jgi:hypothetical protein
MTLLEVLLAFSILAVVVVLVVGSLRVGVRAWEAGERQASVQQEMRALVEVLTESLASAYPYKGRLGVQPERVVLFEGEAEAVRFVTAAPPLALDAPAVPFHAVSLRRSDDDTLRLVERLVPAEEPFGDSPDRVLSRMVAALRLQYLDDKGAWQDAWDGPQAAAVPAAVRVELSIRSRGKSQPIPPFVVPILLGVRPSPPGVEPSPPGAEPSPPGVGARPPGVRPSLPGGAGPSPPGVRPSPPGVRPSLPGVRPSLPGVGPRPPGKIPA